MDPLIYKTTLEMERSPAWLSPGMPLALTTSPDGTVRAVASRLARWPFRGEKRVQIGALRPEATELLRPFLDTGVRLRVRIVALVPAHLAPDGEARIAISVWGDARPLP
jgi:hypothetical protein